MRREEVRISTYMRDASDMVGTRVMAIHFPIVNRVEYIIHYNVT